MRATALGILRRTRERALHARYRLFHAHPSHVWLASYPRSGNTWLRFMLHDALLGESDEPHRLRRSIPDIHRGLGGIRRMPANLIKTHYPRNPVHRRVVYLLRDPLACLASYYEYERSRGRPGTASFEAFIRRELRGDGPYGRWDRHAASYLDGGHDEHELLVVRYEAMVLDPAAELARVLAFCGTATPAATTAAVARAHVGRMLERLGLPAEGTDAQRAERVHAVQTRRGRERMPAALRDLIADSPIGAYARRLGY